MTSSATAIATTKRYRTAAFRVCLAMGHIALGLRW
jgi:hypothetical protein